jgi:hypothetical protein
MTKGKRTLLFLSGLLIGCVLVYFTLIRGKDRSYWLPGNRLKEQVKQSKIIFSEHAKCIMACRGISEETVNTVLKEGDVNFGESDVHNTPCPSYAFDGKTKEGKKIRIICTACDSIAEVTTAINLDAGKDTCRCK